MKRAADERHCKESATRTAHDRLLRCVRRALILLPFAFYLLPFCANAQTPWKRQKTNSFAWLHAIYFVDETRGWAVGGKGAMLQTTDGGASWQASKSPTEDTMRDMFFIDERTGWIVCERDIYKLKTIDEARSYLLKTTDGGAIWTRVEAAGRDTNAGLVRVLFSDRDHGWVFGEEGALYATVDGGATWARQSVPTRHLLLGGLFLDARLGFVVGAGATFLYTSDGGASWLAGNLVVADQTLDARVANAALAPAANRIRPRIRALSFIDERRGWAVGSGGAIFTTTNGGRTWHALASQTDADLFDVKFFDEREGWVTGSNGTVLRTRNGGATWEQLTTGVTHQLERLFFTSDRTRGWAVGFGGTILNYVDGQDKQDKN